MNLQETDKLGKLFLVSAGIGDPDNLTLRAIKTIESADIIIAMPFVQKQIQAYIPHGVEVIDAGHGLFTELARRGQNDTQVVEEQEHNIRELVYRYFNDGQSVVVVEFGDPTLFGPQIGYIKEFSNLKPTIIPGISSFNAANAMLKQPILNRSSQTLMLSSVNAINDYQGQKPGVLVLFTMRMELEKLVETLLERYNNQTPIALAFNAGFSDEEQVIYSSLGELVAKSKSINIPWECLVYVGSIGEI